MATIFAIYIFDKALPENIPDTPKHLRSEYLAADALAIINESRKGEKKLKIHRTTKKDGVSCYFLSLHTPINFILVDFNHLSNIIQVGIDLGVKPLETIINSNICSDSLKKILSSNIGYPHSNSSK